MRQIPIVCQIQTTVNHLTTALHNKSCERSRYCSRRYSGRLILNTPRPEQVDVFDNPLQREELTRPLESAHENNDISSESCLPKSQRCDPDGTVAAEGISRMTPEQFYSRVWIKEHGNDPRGDWPMRFAAAYADYFVKQEYIVARFGPYNDCGL